MEHVMTYVIIETDEDHDIRHVYGPFMDTSAAMTWLRAYIPRWTKEYEEETNCKAKVMFYDNKGNYTDAKDYTFGAADGTTCTRWLIKPVEAHA
jgi:hypothetical protein